VTASARRRTRALALAGCLVALLLVLLAVRRCIGPPVHGDPGLVAADAAAGDPRCQTASGALPIAPLTATWESDENEGPVDGILSLTATGDLRQVSKPVGRVTGACIVDTAGRVLVRVEGSRVVSGRGKPFGVFERTGSWTTMDRDVVAVGETLRRPDGSSLGISTEKGVLVSNAAGPRWPDAAVDPRQAAPMPATVEGPVASARRTALLLLALIGPLTLGHPAPSEP